MGQKTGTGQSACDRSRRYRRLDDPVAAAAGVLGSNLSDYPEVRRHVLQPLGDVLTQHLESPAAVRADGRIRLMKLNLARQVGWEGATTTGNNVAATVDPR